MIKYVVLADLHLTVNPLDEYRWDLLHSDQVIKHLTQDTVLIIIGDLTEQKDKHTEALVTRVSNLIRKYSKLVLSVIILSGNHDGISSDRPFFRFINMLSNVTFIVKPKEIDKTLYLPHSRDPYKTWKNVFTNTSINTVFMHQSIKGSITQSGFTMNDGINVDIFPDNIKHIYSGDVHAPQKHGRVVYVGAPYHIYFGDVYQGRLLILNNKFNIEKSVPLYSITKHKIRITAMQELDHVKIQENDQVAIEYVVDIDEKHTWQKERLKIREYIKIKKAHLCSLNVSVNKPKINKEQQKKMNKNKPTIISDDELILQHTVDNKLTNFYRDRALTLIEEASCI